MNTLSLPVGSIVRFVDANFPEKPTENEDFGYLITGSFIDEDGKLFYVINAESEVGHEHVEFVSEPTEDQLICCGALVASVDEDFDGEDEEDSDEEPDDEDDDGSDED